MLPTNPEMEWPPPPARRTCHTVARLAAWYGGDMDELRPAGVTSGGGWKDMFRSTKRGVAGGYSDSFPLHVPLAADIARTSADLLFGEAPKIEVDDEAAQARLDLLLDECGIDSMLPEQAELSAALSGVYWRVSYDSETIGRRAFPSWIQPDAAVPEWSWGVLTGVTFWRVLPPIGREATVWRYLERHSAGQVEYGLYAGTADRLGTPTPLTDHPDTAGLVAALSADQVMLLPGLPMTAGYVPNMRPNRRDRASYEGRADIEQQEDLLRSVDDTWTSWMRDLRLGKGRMIIPSEYLRPGALGQGAAFDVDREIYSPLQMPPAADGSKSMHLVQFAIRTAEHEATLRALVQQVVTGCGYSLATFGMGQEGTGGVTATEVNARERLSMMTREKKTRYWSAGLSQMTRALLALDSHLGFSSVGAVDLPAVTFGSVVAEDPQRNATTADLLNRATAASKETLVRLVHPDWDEPQVLEEVARILNETGLTVPDPVAGSFLPQGAQA